MKVIKHKLMIKPGTSEVKKKKHVQGGDKNITISAKLSKLTKVGILREAIFPTWIANLVMVNMHDGTWRMCIDYSDLNMICPND